MDDLEDDEPMLWDELEEQYGRPLTPAELRDELDRLLSVPMTDEEFEDELRSQAAWKELKAEITERQAVAEAREAHDNKVAEDLYDAICSPFFDDENEEIGSAEFSAWVERVNEIIRTRLDFYSLCEIVRISAEIGAGQKASRMAAKRHTENRSMKAEVFKWLDSNMVKFKSMEAAAQGIAGKVAPIAFRTARDWVGEWKKVRSTGTP